MDRHVINRHQLVRSGALAIAAALDTATTARAVPVFGQYSGICAATRFLQPR